MNACFANAGTLLTQKLRRAALLWQSPAPNHARISFGLGETSSCCSHNRILTERNQKHKPEKSVVVHYCPKYATLWRLAATVFCTVALCSFGKYPLPLKCPL